MGKISRGYPECKTCIHLGKWSKCAPCDVGQNFEPEETEGLNFDEPSFMDANWGSDDE